MSRFPGPEQVGSAPAVQTIDPVSGAAVAALGGAGENVLGQMQVAAQNAATQANLAIAKAQNDLAKARMQFESQAQQSAQDFQGQMTALQEGAQQAGYARLNEARLRQQQEAQAFEARESALARQFEEKQLQKALAQQAEMTKTMQKMYGMIRGDYEVKRAELKQQRMDVVEMEVQTGIVQDALNKDTEALRKKSEAVKSWIQARKQVAETQETVAPMLSAAAVIQATNRIAADPQVRDKVLRTTRSGEALASQLRRGGAGGLVAGAASLIPKAGQALVGPGPLKGPEAVASMLGELVAEEMIGPSMKAQLGDSDLKVGAVKGLYKELVRLATMTQEGQDALPSQMAEIDRIKKGLEESGLSQDQVYILTTHLAASLQELASGVDLQILRQKAAGALDPAVGEQAGVQVAGDDLAALRAGADKLADRLLRVSDLGFGEGLFSTAPALEQYGAALDRMIAGRESLAETSERLEAEGLGAGAGAEFGRLIQEQFGEDPAEILGRITSREAELRGLQQKRSVEEAEAKEMEEEIQRNQEFDLIMAQLAAQAAGLGAAGGQ